MQYVLILLAPALVGVSVAVGAGLWRLRSWARYAAIVISTLSFLAALWSGISTSLSGFTLVGILANALIVVYLFLPDVKESFV